LRLCVITSAMFRGRGHLDVARAAIAGGATAVQLRAPELDDDRLIAAARSVVDACGQAGVLAIVNDRPDVAVEVGAGGAHVGQDDDVEGARSVLGPDRMLGISVGDVGQVHRAEEMDADYLGVTVWASATKPEAVPSGPDGIRVVASATRLPIVGVGGIDASNAADVIRAGAAGVAVIAAVADADDPRLVVRELAASVRSAAGEGGGGP
jgi:thiamine-phosphate pyrophosphorylase